MSDQHVFSRRIGLQVAQLLRSAQQWSGATSVSMTQLAYAMLDSSAEHTDFRAQASRLNNNGVPLQLCLSCSSTGSSLKLIADPATRHATTEERYLASRHSLRLALQRSAPRLSALAELSMDSLIASDIAQRAHYRYGFVWLAASPVQLGLAFYAEMGPWGQTQGWQVCRDWLAKILPDTQPAMHIVQQLCHHAVVASAGLEGSTPEDARAKVYFRLREPMALSELGVDLLASDEALSFLTLAMGDFSLERDGLILCLGFSLATGALADIKLDLCGHCLRYDAAGWQQLLQQLAQKFCLPLPDLYDVLASQECAMAFIGFGLDVAHRPRINLYLQPGIAQEMPCRRQLMAAADDAISALCQRQMAGGQWQDYALPVGASDQWVTAYVGWALAQYGKAMQHAPAIQAAQRAASWLQQQKTYAAGWGYHDRTGADADSTALAIALFDSLGWPVPAVAREFLRQQWREEGGLATYPQQGAWGNAHWDVTPLGYLGLSHAAQTELRTSFLHGLQQQRLPGGNWRSYWWRNPHYSTLGTLETLQQLQLAEPAALPKSDDANTAQASVDNPFDLACVLGSATLRGVAVSCLSRPLRALLNWQGNDGMWQGSANLRVTTQDCATPWLEARGDYYVDLAGSISTATVLRVLPHILVSLPAEQPAAVVMPSHAANHEYTGALA